MLTDPDRPSLAARLGGAASCLVLGFVTGAIGTFAHQTTWAVGPLRLPLGLVVALAAVTCLVVGIRLALDSRLHAGLAVAGILAAAGLFALPGPSGSALLPANLPGYAWTFGPAIVGGLVLAWPRVPLRRGAGARPTGWDTGRGEDGIQ
ncbi:hypothetical protein [Naasia sp. SYSU D00948]|uniref:hypothetical protein n=1 Tax=Naasia sp. SYSU D00948 TaxID=2817379 RepID=UPI001B3177DC|nr:hypothetical protein [Naasia sp. SYSU D00948]